MLARRLCNGFLDFNLLHHLRTFYMHYIAPLVCMVVYIQCNMGQVPAPYRGFKLGTLHVPGYKGLWSTLREAL